MSCFQPSKRRVIIVKIIKIKGRTLPYGARDGGEEASTAVTNAGPRDDSFFATDPQTTNYYYYSTIRAGRKLVVKNVVLICVMKKTLQYG